MIRLFQRRETPTSVLRLRGFQFPRAIIAYVVWSYHRVAMSTADVEDLVAGAFVLDILVQTRRNTKAAKRFLQMLINQFGEPRAMITDKLCSCVKPIKTLAPEADHRAHEGLDNTIDGSHRPTRKREKIFGRFKSHRQTQRLLSAHDQTNLIFRPPISTRRKLISPCPR